MTRTIKTSPQRAQDPGQNSCERSVGLGERQHFQPKPKQQFKTTKASMKIKDGNISKKGKTAKLCKKVG